MSRKSTGTNATSAALSADMLTAVDVALAAIVETQGAEVVGIHKQAYVDDSGFAFHEFECLMGGYPQWNWTVVLTSAPGQAHATVCDVVLLPGDGALVPPQWIPWSQRIRPGDIGPGDVLPSDPNDVRLVPGYEATDGDSEDVLDAVWELGLGRERVLSREGQDAAAHRWWFGGNGPESAEARLAPHPCATCGFFVGIKGALNQAFGVCANELSSADGRVVSVRFGCGAHSEIKPAPVAKQVPMVTVDEIEYEVVDVAQLKESLATDAESTLLGSEVDHFGRADEVADSDDSESNPRSAFIEDSDGAGEVADSDDSESNAESVFEDSPEPTDEQSTPNQAD